MLDRESIDMSGTDAISFFKLDPLRARGLALRVQERLDEEVDVSMADRLVVLYDECQSMNEMLFVSSCVGALTYGQSHIFALDTNPDNPIPRYLVSVAETLRQLSYVAVNKAHNTFLVAVVEDVRKVLDEIVVTNLEPNHDMVQDIMQRALQRTVEYEKSQGV